MKVRYSYLPQKFKGCLEPGHPILEGMKALLESGDFTLGKSVQEFERKFAKLVGAKYAVGVANGTDALRISLRMAGVGPGDEVITAANTFVASAGCIDELFAKPVFVDMADNYVLDAEKLEEKITRKTKAIIPVWFTGEPPEMDMIMRIANGNGIPVIEDACQAVLAEYKGKCAGNFGIAGAFSLHPLKNLNVWGDGGMITTNSEEFYEKIKLYRNHGMVNRDQIAHFGCNSRLDSLQAIVGNYLIEETRDTVAKRRENAAYYDSQLRAIPGVHLIERSSYTKSCFHLYFFEVSEAHRNDLLQFLQEQGIEAKIHYPIPLQGALGLKGYGREDFPVAYRQSDRILTVAVDEHITKDQQDYVIERIRFFMNAKINNG